MRPCSDREMPDVQQEDIWAGRDGSHVPLHISRPTLLTMYLKPLGSISSMRALTFCLLALHDSLQRWACAWLHIRHTSPWGWGARADQRTSQMSFEYWLMRALSLLSHAALASVLASSWGQLTHTPIRRTVRT